VLIKFDPAKNGRNIAIRGLSFERAADFDFGTALFETDQSTRLWRTPNSRLCLLDGRCTRWCT